MKKSKHRAIWLLVIAYIAFIFHNSLQVAETSAAISTEVTNKLLPFLSKYGFSISFSLFHYYVRKMAHFAEFAVLGFLVSIAMNISPLFKSRLLNFTLFLFLVPFTDEMIQQFVDGRSSQVFDMLIDGSGILFGGLIGYIITLIFKDLFTRPKSAQ